MFKKLKLDEWRQFTRVDLDFHPRLTVIAGANGAGKSTVLRILAQFFGVEHGLIGEPLEGDTRVYSHAKGQTDAEDFPNIRTTIGSVVLSNEDVVTLSMMVKDDNVVTDVNLTHFQKVDGVFIHPHLGANRYVSVGHLPLSGKSLDGIYSEVTSPTSVFSHYNSIIQYPIPLNSIKHSLITLAAFGPGTAYITKNQEMTSLFEGFRDLLRGFLPESLGFVDFSVRLPEIVLVTRTGEFALDASSGGITSLINLAWTLFIVSKKHSDGFSVVIDEPENHLHPAMQRELMESLLKAFPKGQFIVATHSPFIVSSVRDSRVYTLRYSDDGLKRRVYSEQIDRFDKAGTASEILRSVLGVPVTMPNWAETEIEEIASEFNIQELTEHSIENLRARLEAAGLGSYYSQTLTKMAERL